MTWVKSSYSTCNGTCAEVSWRKASASMNGGHCVEVAWRKATGSHANGNCVEAGPGEDGMVHVRDSKDPGGPQLQFAPSAWKAFTAGVSNGEFAQ
jgi:hypothetical protein